MKSQKEKYEKYIKEIALGFIKANKRGLRKSKLKLNYDKICDLIKKEISYNDYIFGKRIKRLNINGMEYIKKTKLTNPASIQPEVKIKSLGW